MNTVLTTSRFPVSTSVTVYKPSAWPGGLPSGVPSGASTGVSATVAADHTLTFAGLEPGVDYVAYAQVSSVDIVQKFRADKTTSLAGFWIPGNGKARTLARSDATGNIAGPASGTIYVAGGEGSILRKGDRITTVGLVSGTTALSSGTHSWAGIADQNRKVLAVSADDTTATLAANTGKEFTLATPFTADSDMPIYFFTCWVGTGPSLQGVTLNNAAVSALVPILCGSSDTGQTTPPAVGATLGAITATALLQLLYAR